MDSDHQLETSLENSDDELSSRFHEIMARLRTALGASNDTELAKALGVTQGTISSTKRRRAIPPAWIARLALRNEISADWLLTGEGSMRRGKAELAKVSYIDPAVQLVDEATKETGIAVNERQKKALVELIREEMKSKAADMLKVMKGA